MKKEIEEEIKHIIRTEKLLCSAENFPGDDVYWDKVSRHQYLSKDFIREFQNSLCWECISQYQKLSEDFIRRFRSRVNWKGITYYQEYSPDFIREFVEKLDLNWLEKEKKVKIKREVTIFGEGTKEESEIDRSNLLDLE